MRIKMKVVIVIPAYNEENTIGKVIQNLNKRNYNNIIVVDDGSSDSSYEVAKNEGAIVYKHCINRGLGGALNTGISAALLEDADIIVTFDADLQHNPNDIKKVMKPVLDGEVDVAIGNRISKGMPLTRRIGNIGLDLVTYLLFGIYVNDTQSGLRVFSRDAAEELDLRTNRMEISSEIIEEIKDKNLRLKSVPIKPIYTDYSLSKGNSVFSGFKILYKLIIRR